MKADDILELLPSIQYAVLCNSYGKLREFIAYGNDSPHEDWYECHYDSIGAASDFFVLHYSMHYEERCMYVCFENMMEYYRLCRIHSKLHHIRLRDNPLMKDAEHFVEDRMELDGNGGYFVRLQTKVNHKWASGLVIRIDKNYFTAEFELAEAIFEIGSWYERAVWRLRKTLLEEFAFWLPALPEYRKDDTVETNE